MGLRSEYPDAFNEPVRVAGAPKRLTEAERFLSELDSTFNNLENVAASLAAKLGGFIPDVPQPTRESDQKEQANYHTSYFRHAKTILQGIQFQVEKLGEIDHLIEL